MLIQVHGIVFMNVFGSYKRCELLFGRTIESVADEITNLMHMKPPEGFLNKEDKINQIQLAKANLELAMDNVINRCSKVDKDIKSQYEKLKADLLKELIKEQDY